ncbi:WD40 repeat domain-containing protein [Ferrovibrio sp.]|uniref:WD40 repeat domain-containing protein n=1 Tax=Ferrovibrio sp. TaxID=1917215 RepID=UPI0025B8FEFE|nr:WD40 repeat domain-containing protein [Ferrovibrio sp.]MBX3454510.1 WD40 repeat domain-containing protein [Ferrovibrio sp.]
MPEAATSGPGFRGFFWQFDAPVTAIAWAVPDVAAFGLGDGSLALRDLAAPDRPAERFPAHADALLCLGVLKDGGLVSGGADGRLMLCRRDAEPKLLAEAPRKWIEHLAISADADLIAYAVGKEAVLLQPDGTRLAMLADHPSTLSGLAFNARGKRLATAHYNGVSLWWVKSSEQKPKRLNWRGSHVGLSWSPDSRFIMTATQENELHGWRVEDFADMRMSGYPSKPRAMAWSHDSKWLATAGAEVAVCWECAGKGPMGSTPVEMNAGAMVTAVAFHPRHAILASGHADGAVILGRLGDQRSVKLEQVGHQPIAALAWSPDGRFLMAGGEEGAAAILDFEV